MTNRPHGMSQLDYLWTTFGESTLSNTPSSTPSDNVILTETAVNKLIESGSSESINTLKTQVSAINESVESLLSDVKEINTNRIKDLGVFTTSQEAWNASISDLSTYKFYTTFASEFPTFHIYRVDNLRTNATATSGIIYNSYYISINDNTFIIWQYMSCEGLTGKTCYRKITCSYNVGTSDDDEEYTWDITSVGTWKDLVSKLEEDKSLCKITEDEINELFIDTTLYRTEGEV